MQDLKQLIRKLSALRKIGGLAYRGAICNQKGCFIVHWIIGKLYAKNKGPNSKDEKVIGLPSPF